MQKIDLLPSENGQYSSDRGPAPVLMSDTTCAHRLWPDADAEECYHRHRKNTIYPYLYSPLSNFKIKNLIELLLVYHLLKILSLNFAFECSYRISSYEYSYYSTCTQA